MAELPGHFWILKGVREVKGAARFLYGCTRCPALVLNGEALPKPWNEKCKVGRT